MAIRSELAIRYVLFLCRDAVIHPIVSYYDLRNVIHLGRGSAQSGRIMDDLLLTNCRLKIPFDEYEPISSIDLSV